LLIVAVLLLANPVSGHAEKLPGMAGFRLFPNAPMANDFPMTTPQGNTLKLSDLKGQVVILNFWREHCPWCVVEKRYLKGMLKQLENANVKVLCVNFSDNPSAVRSYGLQAGGDLLIAARPDNQPRLVPNVLKGRLMGYYVVNDNKEAIYEIKGFPSSYVIDKTGAIVASHMGMVEWTQPAVRNWVATLAGPSRPEPASTTDEYVLPEWLNRLLSSPPKSSVRTFAGARAGAEVGPAN
jgi:peroxiredoxin